MAVERWRSGVEITGDASTRNRCTMNAVPDVYPGLLIWRYRPGLRDTNNKTEMKRGCGKGERERGRVR